MTRQHEVFVLLDRNFYTLKVEDKSHHMTSKDDKTELLSSLLNTDSNAGQFCKVERHTVLQYVYIFR